MELRNTGNVHVKISEVRYPTPEGAEENVEPTVFYLHPGKTGFLPVQMSGQEAGGTVELITDTAGTLEYALVEPQ